MVVLVAIRAKVTGAQPVVAVLEMPVAIGLVLRVVVVVMERIMIL
jgi:hypothetical protein